jgi:hypothetical protein
MKMSLSKLTKDKVIGLVTVKPKTSYFKKEFILFQSIAYLLDAALTMPTEEN